MPAEIKTSEPRKLLINEVTTLVALSTGTPLTLNKNYQPNDTQMDKIDENIPPMKEYDLARHMPTL